MSKILQKYFDENFFIIPIRKLDKRPLYKNWTDSPLSLFECKEYVKRGYNLAVVSGKQSVKSGYNLVIIDIDNRPAEFDTLFYRRYNTWISLTPNGGYHIYLRVRPFENITKVDQFLKKYDLEKQAHRTTLNPNHQDNTMPNPTYHDAQYFADTIRWTSMYALLKPSKLKTLNGEVKNYWWLDDAKGEILKL